MSLVCIIDYLFLTLSYHDRVNVLPDETLITIRINVLPENRDVREIKPVHLLKF